MTPRLRFAPSPTGPLHLGGLRTVLYNYLFARQRQGKFILRIEDTDRSRYVPGSEEYIFRCLKWCGLLPDESPHLGGPSAPYRQSERKALYAQYALQLVRSGHAYYAFDTPEELEEMRQRLKTDENPSPQYNGQTRMGMRNALSLGHEAVEQMLDDGVPYVVRLKMPEDETVVLHDMVRGEVSFNTSQSDDKVLLKADGMPTYHLAVVVDDCLMGITHAFRGEEWLPSAPAHILLWRYLGWESRMPQWAHLPLILKPDGHGKLSKRDGDRLGFPVFALDWQDPKTGELSTGFRERGFLPEAFINMLAMLGWNDGTGQEIFSPEELVARFDMARVQKGGARFDYEKAKWYNQQHIQQKSPEELAELVKPFVPEAVAQQTEKLISVVRLVQDRLTLLTDFWEHGHYFFERPQAVDYTLFAAKWSSEKSSFLKAWLAQNAEHWQAANLEASFGALSAEAGIKKGEVLLPLRIMLVGGKHGPAVFEIAALLGYEESAARIRAAVAAL